LSRTKTTVLQVFDGKHLKILTGGGTYINATGRRDDYKCSTGRRDI